MALTMALSTTSLLALGVLGGAVIDAARAQIAADAAALAGVVGGPGAAEEAAYRNGGRLVDYVVENDDVIVGVEFRAVRERARASR